MRLTEQDEAEALAAAVNTASFARRQARHRSVGEKHAYEQVALDLERDTCYRARARSERMTAQEDASLVEADHYHDEQVGTRSHEQAQAQDRDEAASDGLVDLDDL